MLFFLFDQDPLTSLESCWISPWDKCWGICAAWSWWLLLCHRRPRPSTSSPWTRCRTCEGEILQTKRFYYPSENWELRWCRGKGTLFLQVKLSIQGHKGPQGGMGSCGGWKVGVGRWGSNGWTGGWWAEVTNLFLMCCREPRQRNCPFTMMARRLHRASHSSMLRFTDRGRRRKVKPKDIDLIAISHACC